MKNIPSFIKRIICLVTLIAVCLSTLSLSVMASENNSIEKIDSQLSLLLSDMSDNDTTSVSIWFKDISKSELAEKTIENLNDMVICNDLPSEVLDVLTNMQKYNESNMMPRRYRKEKQPQKTAI